MRINYANSLSKFCHLNVIIKSFASLHNKNEWNRRKDGIKQTNGNFLGFRGLFFWDAGISHEKGQDAGGLDTSPVCCVFLQRECVMPTHA